MENINELKHRILDCADYFGWKIKFFNDDSILISLDENTMNPSGCGYHEMEKIFHMSVDYEMSQMTFPEPLPKYKFQIEHFNDLAKYFNWIVDINYASGNNIIAIWNKHINPDYDYCDAYKGSHLPHVVDLVMNEELEKMGLQ